MDVRELQIGDWVYFGEKAQFPMQITSIFGCLDGDDGTVYLDFEGNEGDVFEAEVEDVAPIPITAELLEKNGFKRYTSFLNDGQIYYRLEKDIKFTLFSVHEGESTVYKFRGLRTRIYYVHQLQNAMRLCGIEWEVKI